MKQKIRKALEEPRKIAPYLYWNTLGNLHCLPYRLFYDKQYDKLHKDLFKEDKFLLIVLDACRHDYFEEEFFNFFKGDLEPVYSSGRNTFEYTKNTYPDDHTEMLYISGAVPINSVLDNSEEIKNDFYGHYSPKDHLRIEDVWDYGWDIEKGTVPPEKITEAASEKLEDKTVAHYFQPHSPYIGDYKIVEGPDSNYNKWEESPATDEIVWERYKKGEITEKEMRRAYRSNLREALREVKKLVEKLPDDRRVVITSDHGELFGEGKLYGHPPRQHPGLRLLPWLEVEKTRDGEPRKLLD